MYPQIRYGRCLTHNEQMQFSQLIRYQSTLHSIASTISTAHNRVAWWTATCFLSRLPVLLMHPPPPPECECYWDPCQTSSMQSRSVRSASAHRSCQLYRLLVCWCKETIHTITTMHISCYTIRHVHAQSAPGRTRVRSERCCKSESTSAPSDRRRNCSMWFER